MDIVVKFIMYLIRKLFLFILVLSLVGTSFFTARDVANVYIIVNEGLELRVISTLEQNIEPELLHRFFSDSLLRTDPVLNGKEFQGFNVSDYELRIRIRPFLVLPWANSVEIKVEEAVSDLAISLIEESGEQIDLPAWNNGLNLIELERIRGRWQITQITFVE